MNFPSCCRVRGLELESNAETTQPNSCGLSNSSKSMAGGFFHATLSLHNFSNLKSKTFECFECSTTLVGGFKHFYLFFNFHTYLGKIPILANIFFRWVVETTNMYFFHKKSIIYIWVRVARSWSPPPPPPWYGPPPYPTVLAATVVVLVLVLPSTSTT